MLVKRLSLVRKAFSTLRNQEIPSPMIAFNKAYCNLSILQRDFEEPIVFSVILLPICSVYPFGVPLSLTTGRYLLLLAGI